MQRPRSFSAGLVTGLVLAGATALAGNVFHAWTPLDVDAANLLFRPRSGLNFHASPPDPCDGLTACSPQTLTVNAAPSATLTQVIAVSNAAPTAESPPDPCFTATLDPADTTVTVQVAHPEQISFVDANGSGLALCPTTGTTGLTGTVGP